jgi:hypothetical protein
MKFWADYHYVVIEADSDAGRPFLCSQARNNAVRQACSEVVVIADADTVPNCIEQVHDAVSMVADREADMVYPYNEFRHIDESAAALPDYTTARVQQSTFDSPGGIFVTTKRFMDRVGWFDESFVPGALGFDDTSFRYAAETFGVVDRVAGIAWSFNHATDVNGLPLRDFTSTNPNWPRYQRYQAARGDMNAMRELRCE